MKKYLYFLILLLLAIGVIIYANQDPGYVLIARGTKTIEMSTVVFLPLLLVSFIAMFFLIRLLIRTWNIPLDVGNWRRQRRQEKSRAAFIKGLNALAEGNWAEAESHLIAHVRHSQSPHLNYLAAAFASQAQNNVEMRDEYLSKAHEAMAENKLAVRMTQAYLQHLSKQSEQALATVTELKQEQPRNRAILRLLMLETLALKDWAALAEQIPDLKRYQVLPDDEMETLEFNTHRHLLTLSLPSGSLEVLRRAWEAIPKQLRLNPELISIYAHKLIEQNEMEEAEKLLRQALNTNWDDKLAELYGLANGPDSVTQLDTAEKWLSSHPKSAGLLLTLGRLALHNKLWGKTHRYLEQCIELSNHPDAYLVLGKLYEQEGKKDEALASYRSGLSLRTGKAGQTDSQEQTVSSLARRHGSMH